jgi:hypothetical protein
VMIDIGVGGLRPSHTAGEMSRLLGDELSMKYVCGSLALAAVGVEITIAFFQQTSSYLVASHGGVLGATLAPRDAWSRADTFHSVSLMCAVAVEFFVMMFNPNMRLNFFASLLAVVHMAYFFMWSRGVKPPLKKEKDEGIRWKCTDAAEMALETSTFLGCAIVDCVLAPNVGFVALKSPEETLAFTLAGTLVLARVLPHLRLKSHHPDFVAVSFFTAALLLAYAIYTTVVGWYVQCAYLWSLFGFVLVHFGISRILARKE